MVHLYWQHTQPKWFERIRRGYSACGKSLPREQLTRWPDDNECPVCAAKLQEKAPAQSQGQEVSDKSQPSKQKKDDQA